MQQSAVTPATDPTIKSPLLRVENVVKHFPTGGAFGRAVVHAVDDVSLAIQQGETLGLVGESGCGKSTLGRVIVQLQPATSGHIYFKDTDLTKLRGEKLRRMRQQVQMIFQDPYASLNPRMTVGDIVSEPLRNFRVARGRKAEQKVQEVMRVVGLNLGFVNRYPHEFSWSQRPHPKGPGSTLPVPDSDLEGARKPSLLKGKLPSPVTPRPACRFHTRCPIAQKICSEVEPPLEMKESGRFAACHFAGQL